MVFVLTVGVPEVPERSTKGSTSHVHPLGPHFGVGGIFFAETVESNLGSVEMAIELRGEDVFAVHNGSIRPCSQNTCAHPSTLKSLLPIVEDGVQLAKYYSGNNYSLDCTGQCRNVCPEPTGIPPNCSAALLPDQCAGIDPPVLAFERNQIGRAHV